MFQDDEIIQEFVVESSEHLAGVESQLLEIEDSGEAINLDLVNTIFRAVHSVKGAAGFLGFTTINELAHNLENVLNQIRNQELSPTPAIIDTLLRSADQLKSLVDDVSASNGVDVSANVAELKRVLDGDAEPALAEVVETVVEVAEVAAQATELSSAVAPPESSSGVAPSAESESKNSIDAAFDAAIAEARAKAPKLAAPAAPKAAAKKPVEASPPPALVAEPVTAEKPVASAATKSDKPAMKAPESNVRVNVSILDRLMNLAGELVLGRNQLMQSLALQSQEKMEAVATRLDQVTSELQEAIMQTRMQPVGSVFNKFPRIVRDLSAKLSKKCTLDIEGSEVEVDKTIIEAIGDPLTHIVRNSVDHGVETPDVRMAAGKNPEGRIRLRAFHQAGKVCIRIEDDGGGIDAERIKAKALQNGLISQSEAATMSTNDILRLIFAPGFSTAAQVTDVSGRGVGMDVVRTNIEQIGGTVDIESELGKGSAMHITLPLTLAIIPSMIVGCGKEKFAIPQTNIAELVRVPAGEFDERIGNIQGAEVLRLRGALLPLVRLDKVLGIREEAETGARAMNVIVVEAGQFRYGVAVDELYDSEEIVVKPLGRQLKDLGYLAGATILGDGRIALILDITGIAAHANLRSCEEEAAEKGQTESDGLGLESHRLLLFRNSPDEQFAIPMACVSRIERAAVKDITKVGLRSLLPYRDSTLPLINVENHITAKPPQDGASHVFVIVFNIGTRELGLVAPELKDICNVVMDVDSSSLREPGVSGVIVSEGVPTRLLDLIELTKVANPEWVAKETREQPKGEKHILFAEDSAFFRRHVEQTLTDEGYRVTTGVDGKDALEQLQQMTELPDVVVTDVEMPNMSGLQFCQAIRSDPRTANLPVIALTSLASEDDVARGKSVGVDDYQVKLDKNNLLTAVARYIKTGR